MALVSHWPAQYDNLSVAHGSFLLLPFDTGPSAGSSLARISMYFVTCHFSSQCLVEGKVLSFNEVQLFFFFFHGWSFVVLSKNNHQTQDHIGFSPVIFWTLEKETATHSSILAWKTPWTEEPGTLQSMGLQRVGHDWATLLYLLEGSF